MLEKLKKKYRGLLAARWGCFVASILCCIIPAVAVIRMALPSITAKSNWLGLSTFGICMASIIVFIVAKGAIREISEKIPFTVGVMVSEIVILGVLIGLKGMIEDAILIFEVAASGACVGSIFNVASYFLNIEAKTTKEKIIRVEVKDE